MFSRQEAIEGWDQSKITTQKCLVLGLGALGSCLSIQLLRLGVAKLIIIDKDIVDHSNLNRQLTYSNQSLSQYKCQSTFQNLQFHNIANAEIEQHHLDVIHKFDKVTKLVQQADVVFNTIDYGDSWDYAVQSACIKSGKHLIMGGSFSHTFTIDIISRYDQFCLLCLNPSSQEYLQQIIPSKINSLEQLCFLPANNNPGSQSNVFLANQCVSIMVSQYVHKLLFNEPECQENTRFIVYSNTQDVVKFPGSHDPQCLFCQDRSAQSGHQ